MHFNFVTYKILLDHSVSILAFLTNDGVEQDIQIITTCPRKEKLMEREDNVKYAKEKKHKIERQTEIAAECRKLQPKMMQQWKLA